MSVQHKQEGKIVRVAGPVVDISGLTEAQLYEIVRVGEEELIGEIIRINDEGPEHIVTTQVYEETSGIKPGEPAYSTGLPLSAQLGPGILSTIYDGIQRPLSLIKESTQDDFIRRGIIVAALNHDKTYDFTPSLKVGDQAKGGQVIGEVPETETIMHRILVPPHVPTIKITEVASPGSYTIDEIVARGKDNTGREYQFKMYHEWPVRIPRPYIKKLPATVPLITGQRIFDTFFPIAKGGTGAIPGGFGTGKTVSQHQLAKWSDAEVVVYIGCGERGNEMTEVLEEFPHLKDPRTGKELMERTTLIANTSNMPVAAREASIYTGITLAEYYRDMGYDVSLMADSTSRWAEALREISSRLEEMPGEEGYPAYLASKISEFYERTGRVITLNGKEASVTAVGAVSPPGGDFSEPVTQNTLRTVRVFWALSKKLASQRHFPAIDWLLSYSLYDSLDEWFNQNVSSDFVRLRKEAMALLQREKELQEIVQLVGPDALPDAEKIVMRTTKLIREAFLQQNAFIDEDSYCPLDKQYHMLKAIITLHHKLLELHDKGVPAAQLLRLTLYATIDRFKYNSKEEFEKNYNDVMSTIKSLSPENITKFLKKDDKKA